MLLLFATTIFLSAFLLFQVQPLISRTILPWFGGTPAVWTTCMLFFQLVLFGGYLYSHLITSKLSFRTQAIVHSLVIVAASLTLPIEPSNSWKPDGTENPIPLIILVLGVSVGLPFFVVSTTGPLLQRWYSHLSGGASPYRLYSLSNIGSLLALISYPFAFEPMFDAHQQAWIWSGGFVLFALCGLACTLRLVKKDSGELAHSDAATKPAALPTPAEPSKNAPTDSWSLQEGGPKWSDRVLWFLLAMAPSMMLLATTNQLCMDVASVPFLWIAPLTLYLLSFILCFDSDRWYGRGSYGFAFWVLMACVVRMMLVGAGAGIMVQGAVYLAGMFFYAMVCHGELAKLRPDPRWLTGYFLVISAGGAAGGLFVGIIAPLIFPLYLELHVSIVLGGVLLLWATFRDPFSLLNRILEGSQTKRWLVWGSLSLAIVASLTYFLRQQAEAALKDEIAVRRSFFGVLRVTETISAGAQGNYRDLVHGRILHGRQFTKPPFDGLATTYYALDSGAGQAIRESRSRDRQKVGVVGLGVGTLTRYARPGDDYRVYEIDSDVVDLATEYFTYLPQARKRVVENQRNGSVSVVLGDARLSMEREEPQEFDALLLDAFSSDAIPMHLLTVEAFETWLRHLRPDGILAVHISNRHFDLRPVTAALADHFNLHSVSVSSDGDDNSGSNAARWVLFSRVADNLNAADIAANAEEPTEKRVLWTDARSNLLSVFKEDNAILKFFNKRGGN